MVDNMPPLMLSMSRTDKEAVFSLDISKAYPSDAKVASWKRTIRLKRNESVNIREDYKLTSII